MATATSGGETGKDPSGWTTDTLASLHAALRESDLRFDAERDRRLTEVAVEREKALKIKEEADSRALILQAETQKYKDEKANELRSQIERERGTYVTQADLRGAVSQIQTELKPLSEFVSANQGGRRNIEQAWTYLVGAVVAAGGVVAIVIAIT